MCNDFTNHCSTGSGLRSQFATYDNTQSAADAERLYFKTLNTNERVYLGFQGSTLVNPLRHIVFRIKDLAGNIVLSEQTLPTSGAGYIASFGQAQNGPNQLILTPPYNGYTALEFNPAAAGTYYIEFSCKRNDNGNFHIGSFNLLLFDITIGNTVTQLAKPGRLYSKSWQFYEDSDFYGKNYFISDDSIVTSSQFSGMQGGHWIQYCNQTGCGSNPANWIISRKSLYEQQALFPQYKIFLNEPDPLLFPPATTLGQVIAPLPYGVQNCQTGHIVFHVTVNKPGNAELTLTFPAPYQPYTMSQAVVAGDNLFDWDGLDGSTPTRLVVPNGTSIQFTVKYINGLTNLPLYDVEGNSNGFTIALVSPPGTTPAVFWDDTNIPGGSNNSNPPGCLSPPGCHSWGSNGWGDLHTINTWWYNVSMTTAPVTIYEHRAPATPVFSQSVQSCCANTGGHVYSVVSDPYVSVYHWSYNPPAGVTISQPSPGSPMVTISYGTGASSGVLSVYGSNANCSSAVTTLAVTLNPSPVPSLNGPASVCAGQTNITYTTDPGKTNYVWTVSGGGLITGGGTGTSNTVTVTWNTAGAQSVSVNYKNPGTLCTAPSPTTLPVTVNTHPVPAFTGNTLVCVASGGNVYTTDPGKLNYVWTISSGGTITLGGTSASNTATVQWNLAGPQWIAVSYTDPGTLCAALAPTQLNVVVNTLPTPTFLGGSTSVCVGIPGNTYSTDPGMSNYIWTISGGNIVSGGTSNDSWATVTWTNTGTQVLNVNYTYPGSSCTAPVPTPLNVTVNPLPQPSVISGNTSVCQGSAGNIYTTQPGKLNYDWNVGGGTITAGGNGLSDYATVTWDIAGPRYISVNYTDPVTSCYAASPSVYPVTVKPLPVPSFIAGENPVCLNVAGNVYITQPGKLDYSWSITGGEINPGGGVTDNSATVIWNTVGVQTILVGYTDPVTQCASATPTPFTVIVNPLPEPTFTSGSNSVCKGYPGNIYTTEPGMLNYTWTLTGGTLTDGGTATSNSATVTWDVAGLQSISVIYTDPVTLCRAASPVAFPVTVKPLPVPTLTGPSAACVNTPGPPWFTEPGMSDYLWTAPAGTITPGATPDIVNVVWNVLGVHPITVTYTGLNGCAAESPSQMAVSVNPLPVPGLAGVNTICSGIPTTYTTEIGKEDYDWFVSAGGDIFSGGSNTDHTVTVIWTLPGTRTIGVNYALSTGCRALVPTSMDVTVNQSTTPVIEQNPAAQVCVTSGATYTTQPGMSDYTWTISAGGSFGSSINSNEIIVNWNTVGPQWVRVNFTNSFTCEATTPTQFDVMVNPLPVTNILEAPGPECESVPHVFQTTAEPGCTFNWTISPEGRGEVTDGQGTNAVLINWLSYGPAVITVTSTNTSTGCTASSDFPTTVLPKPYPVFTPCFDVVTTPNAKKFTLRGAAPFIAGQGVFSGYRVSLNGSSGLFEFDPYGALPGTYPVTYTYTNTYGCPASPPAVNITVQDNPFSCGGYLTDVRDGKKYKTSVIGGKCWMSENLVFGTDILHWQPSTDNCINERYCLQADASCTTYGGLYQWDELMRYGSTSASQGICPPEWHVPSETELQGLLDALSDGITPPDGVAGGFLKNSGFNLLPGGLLYFNNTWAYSSETISGSMLWTSTPAGAERAVARGINTINPSASRYAGSRANAFSVRCLMD
jgi:uncharacterized protein (TIGR02145 family)